MAFNAAADIGDSVGAFGKGVYGAGKGLVTGTVGLAVGAAKLQNEVVIGTAELAITGNPNRLHNVASEVKSGAQAAWQEVKTTAALAKAGYSNPMLALDAATELGIERTSEIVGGATFETALLVAPMAKGAPVAAVAQEGRGATILAAVEESRAARAASRFGEYAGNPAVRAAEAEAGYVASAGTAGVSGTTAAAGSGLSLGSRAARDVLQPVMRGLGSLPRVLRPGQRLTAGDKLRRFFLQDTKGYPGVSSSPAGRFLKNNLGMELEQHHVFLQRKWIRPGGPHQWYPTDVLAQRGLQRLTDAGWNLMPIPKVLNRALGRSSIGTAAFASGVAGAIGGGVYASVPGPSGAQQPDEAEEP